MIEESLIELLLVKKTVLAIIKFFKGLHRRYLGTLQDIGNLLVNRVFPLVDRIQVFETLFDDFKLFLKRLFFFLDDLKK